METSLSNREEYKHNWYVANKELTAERARTWRQENIGKARAQAKIRRTANPEKTKEYFREYRARNAETIKQHIRNWKTANPGKVNADTAKRYTNKLQRTPPWLTKEHLEQIRLHYVEASRLTKLTGICFHVDHVVPLNGKAVSGLHVPWNLQILPYYANIAKGNKYAN